MELVTIHLTTLALTALVILYADHEAFSYMRGKKETLSPQFVTWSHRLVWAGLLGMIASGFLLAYPGLDYYLEQFAFRLKMAFVAVLTINAFFIGTLSRVALLHPFASLTPSERLPLMISGAVSACGWVGAAIIGFYFL